MIATLEWRKLPDGDAEEIWKRVVDEPDAQERDGLAAYEATLPFYKRIKLVQLKRLALEGGRVLPSVYALHTNTDDLLPLDGTSTPIHAANELDDVKLTQDTVADYIRFFCFAVHGGDGPFMPFEHLPLALQNSKSSYAAHARPLHASGRDAEGRFLYDAVIVYDKAIAECRFAVKENGEIEMLDDKPVEVMDVDLRAYTPQLDTTVSLVSEPAKFTPPPLPPKLTPARPAVLVLFELLLEAGLAQRKHHRLIETFNATTTATAPLEQFAELAHRAFPVVAIETGLPFAEEALASVLVAHQGSNAHLQMVVSQTRYDNATIAFTLPNSGPALVLIPLQVYRAVEDVERIAHQIAVREFGALIACEAFRDLPECLRRLVDITIRLPPVDAQLFEALFAGALGAYIPAGWRAQGTEWVRHILPTDFEHPRRMQLAPDRALEYIRQQVTERVQAVDPIKGLGLKQLHGLGEARQFAEDLINDIHSAIAGQIPWTQVDRGVLLVGPPGTGKTTLARAIAKDCGVKFVNASASSWQAAGSLPEHLGAIRRSFSEARRYAPSILFIDEIDSLGNRENMTGSNAIYQTDVVNAVLEQLQGIDPEAPVFVIGATNHENNVDPALKRAGRLDRVIFIPRPNVEALRMIYEHYLREAAQTIVVDSDIDPAGAAGLSLGYTGAEVERVVRGAARRARKARRALSQDDLIAEITRRPLDPNEAIRLLPEEMKRVAIHESGHALAKFLSGSAGADIGFVSIVPRSDGTLGFVASLPDGRQLHSRVDLLLRLEVMLAGRAAEALHFGPSDVSDGAGSDLQVATQLALNMVIRSGLGKAGRLRWSEQPQASDLAEVDEMLAEAYSRVRRKLQANWSRVERLAKALMDGSELSGAQVRGILSGRETPAARKARRGKVARSTRRR